MSRIFLMGHSGSINRGCEAIVRSTVKLLNNEGIYDISFTSDADTYDKKLNLDKYIKLYSRKNVSKYSLGRIFAKIVERCFGDYRLNEIIHFGDIYKNIQKEDIALVIGGDTYCYTRPAKCYAINKIFKAHGATTVLWGCSLEENLIDSEMLEDLKRYDYICPREIITYNTLINQGIPENKIIFMSDPAFNLNIQKIDMKDIEDEDNIVGINMSTILSKNEKAYESAVELVRYIVEETDMKVVLIPHVYGINSIDLEILQKIKNEFGDNKKILLIDKQYNCEELKYIISKCRFFVGARTHSTIAAYSLCIPTLVLGYSVKSRGIATDLFGDFKDFVVMYDALKDKNELKNTFINLVKNENEIKEKLISLMSEYKNRGISAAKKIKQIGNFPKINTVFVEKYACNGCGVCANICPKNCIEMKKDEYGFLYPEIKHELCINCGVCSKNCPQKIKPVQNDIKKIVALWTKDEKIREESSSGGAFTVFAKSVLDKGGIVFGAGFDKDFNCIHKSVKTYEDLDELRRSKYVQSEIGNTYKEAKQNLDKGVDVLFCGTPCQIQGLKKFLQKDYENLLTVDFICHGVPSPKSWIKFLVQRKKENNSSIKSVSFRSKDNGWKTYSMKIEFENGNTYIKKITEDTYLRAFIEDISLRPSCNNCGCKNFEKASDITLADFWGIKRIKPEITDDTGVSMVILRTDKALDILEEQKENIVSFEVDADAALKMNPSIIKSVRENRLRSKFFNDLNKIDNYDKISEKYCGLGILAKLRRKILK